MLRHPVFAHGTETWTMKAEDKSRITIAEKCTQRLQNELNHSGRTTEERICLLQAFREQQHTSFPPW
jgi:hypothetical protein